MQKLLETLGTKILGSDHPALLLNLVSQPQTANSSVSPIQGTIYCPSNESKPQTQAAKEWESPPEAQCTVQKSTSKYESNSFLQPTTATNHLHWLHSHWLMAFLTRIDDR